MCGQDGRKAKTRAIDQSRKPSMRYGRFIGVFYYINIMGSLVCNLMYCLIERYGKDDL